MLEEKSMFISQEKRELLDERISLSILFDFYGDLLKEQKRQIFEDYVQNDLSLSEIAEYRGITRQGVHDIVKRCTIELREYDDKLKLIEKFQIIRDKLQMVTSILDDIKKDIDVSKLEQMEQLTMDIIKEL